MNSVKALLAKTDGTVSEVDFEVEANPYFTGEKFLGAYTSLVMVAQVADEDVLHLVVDEQGHLKGLPVNDKASRFYPAPGNPAGLPPGDPPIVGDVVFVQMRLVHNPEPDWVPVEFNDEARALLRREGVLS